MLKWLEIANFALIEHLDLEFGGAFNLITGETGAGKSILVDALGFALGARAGADIIRTGEELCRVSAAFRISPELRARLKGWLGEKGLAEGDEELQTKREMNAAGRGRAWINGDSAPLGVLAALGEMLVDFHGQHEHQSLLKVSAHQEMLDRYAGLLGAREEVTRLYKLLEDLEAKRKFLTLSEQDRVRQLDLLAFQIKELETARVKPGETAEMENESRLLASAEKRSLAANQMREALNGQEETAGAVSALGQARKSLKELALLDEGLEDLMRRLDQATIEVEEIAAEVVRYADGIVFDPRRLEEVENRLATLQRLKKKYGGSEESVLAYYDEAKGRIANLESATEQLAEIEAQWNSRIAEFSTAAFGLSKSRDRARTEFQMAVERELKQLGMEKAGLEIKLNRKPQEGGWAVDPETGTAYAAGPKGVDQTEFLLSPNPGEEPRPLVKIASGGELSRVMLALKTVLSRLDPVETLVFDEVDSGISGRVAQVVGEKLLGLSGSRQVLCITHLPQVACQPGQHVRVSKSVEGSRTRVHAEKLGLEERIEEVAGLIGGSQVTDSARAHARGLLDAAGKERGRP